MPINPPQPQAIYVGTRITLTNANQLYNLWQLVVANRPNAPQAGRSVNVQMDPTSGATFYFGDGQMSTTDFGFRLSSADGLSCRWQGDQGNALFGCIFVITDTAGAALNVELVGC